MEGERDVVQKISHKNLKRVDVWKATAVSVCAEIRVVMGQLKSTEEERDVITSKLEEEM